MAQAPRSALDITAYLMATGHRVVSADPRIEGKRRQIIKQMEGDIKKMCDTCLKHRFVKKRESGIPMCDSCFKDLNAQEIALRAEVIANSNTPIEEKFTSLLNLVREIQSPNSVFTPKVDKEFKLLDWISDTFNKKQRPEDREDEPEEDEVEDPPADPQPVNRRRNREILPDEEDERPAQRARME